jgi:hypothetical protein
LDSWFSLPFLLRESVPTTATASFAVSRLHCFTLVTLKKDPGCKDLHQNWRPGTLVPISYGILPDIRRPGDGTVKNRSFSNVSPSDLQNFSSLSPLDQPSHWDRKAAIVASSWRLVVVVVSWADGCWCIRWLVVAIPDQL